MKYKVKEKYTVEVWTYVEADSKEEAIKKLEDGGMDDPDFENPIGEDHQETFWDTMQEV